MISSAASIIVFLLSLIALVLVLMKWTSAPRPNAALQAALGSGEWSRACISTQLRVTEDVLGIHPSFGRKFGRTTLVGLLLLGIVWPMAGWLSGKMMGFSGTPWQLFEQMMELLDRASASQASGAQLHAWASVASSGCWKYVYAGCAIALITLWSAVAFWCAGAVSRYLLRDFQKSSTWAQKSGLLLGLAALTILLLMSLTFLIGLVTSPAPWLAVLLTRAGLGWWADIGLVIAANAFTFYVSDPWLKGLLLVCLFPCLIPLIFAGSALAADIWRLGITGSSEKLIAATQGRLGRAFVPFLMIAIALYSAYWILDRLL